MHNIQTARARIPLSDVRVILGAHRQVADGPAHVRVIERGGNDEAKRLAATWSGSNTVGSVVYGTEAGIFRKTAYRQRPLRHEYRLTDKGAALFTVIVGLKQWGDRYGAAARSGKPMDLVNRGDGRPLKVLGQGEVATKLFVAADSFSASAKTKIEAAGGNILVLAEPKPDKAEKPDTDKSARKAKAAQAEASAESEAPAAESEAPAAESEAGADAAMAEAESSESAEAEN